MRALLSVAVLSSSLFACYPSYVPQPMPVAPQPSTPQVTTGTVTGEVRVFASSASAQGVRSRNSVVDAFRSAPENRVERAGPPQPVLDEAQKTERPVVKRQSPIRLGELVVGLDEPGEAVEVLRRLAPERLGWRCEVRAWASETMALVFCAHRDGSALSEDETRGATDRLGTPAGVKFIETNGLTQAQRAPNDTMYAQQWHYRAMGLPAAWDVTVGASNVVVAVLDTGISAHPDLVANLVPGIDLISDVEMGADGNGRDDDPTDVLGGSWHGTHVAGTIAAASNNGVGVAGVAWNAKVLPVRVLGEGGGTNFDIISGITWATGGVVPGVRTNANVARVVNMSLGGDGAPSTAYQTAIDAATARGAIMVVAAGNEDENTANKVPCNQANVICVAATDARGKATAYTNYGAEVTLAGPGGALDRDDDGDGKPDGVLSTSGGGAYTRLQGTSMATPHIAGLVALMKTLRPSLTFAEARTALVASATPVSNCGTSICGAGLVDAAKAIASLQTQSAGMGRLSLSASALVVTADEPSATVRLSNIGDAALGVSLRGPSAHVANVTWSATAVPLPVSAGQAVSVSLTWRGSFAQDLDVPMTFHSESGESELVLRVRRPRVLPTTQVLLVSKNAEGKWVAAARDNASADGKFELRRVPPGSYYLVAYSDDDGDGTFEATEGRGGWPNSVDEQLIHVTAGSVIADRNFTVAPVEGVDVTIGLACGSPTECQFGDYCSVWPGGYCTRACTEGGCGAGATCLTFSDNSKACVSNCEAPGQGRSTCREGYTCTRSAAGNGVCIP